MRRVGAALVGAALLLGGGVWFAMRAAAPTPEDQAATRAEQARRQVEALEKLGYLGGGSTEEADREPVPEH